MPRKKFDVYQAPSDTVFNDLKETAIQIWRSCDNRYGCVDEKLSKLITLENYKDNYWTIIGMFDYPNQAKLASLVKNKETNRFLGKVFKSIYDPNSPDFFLKDSISGEEEEDSPRLGIYSVVSVTWENEKGYGSGPGVVLGKQDDLWIVTRMKKDRKGHYLSGQTGLFPEEEIKLLELKLKDINIKLTKWKK